jgi:hypothetical protein
MWFVFRHVVNQFVRHEKNNESENLLNCQTQVRLSILCNLFGNVPSSRYDFFSGKQLGGNCI